MNNFPGRSHSEIEALKADMLENCPNKHDLLEYANRCADYADDEIYENDDRYMPSLGYSLSTVRNCAVKIAELLMAEAKE